MTDRETIIREYHHELGKLGGPARWAGVPLGEARAEAMAPARRGRRTNEERFRALMAEVEALRAKVDDLEQRVAA